METFFGFVFDVAAFLVVFTVVVFVHEFGHYWVARRCGVRIVVFSIGFGREIAGWTDRAGTRWRVSLVPLGGYVRFFGDADPSSRLSPHLEQVTAEERAVSFHHKTVAQRSAIVAAGPFANFALSVALLTVLYVASGRSVTPAIIHEVMPDSAAQEAGILPGDRIVALHGERVDKFERVRHIVVLNPDVTMAVTLERDGRLIESEITPRASEQEDGLGNRHRVGMIGVRVNEVVQRRLDPVSALIGAVSDTWTVVVGNLKAIGQIIVGARDSRELGGPIMIAEISGQVAEAGPVAVLKLIVILSAMLGLINLFPIPLLDGGHLAYLAAEAVRGRPVGARVQLYGGLVGLVMVAAIMVFATYNDIARIFERIAG